MAKWKVGKIVEKKFDFSIEIHHLIASILFSRGITDKKDIEKFISPDYEADSNDPFLFDDMEKVINRISIAREKKEKIAIFGDYDADGITSSVILKETFNFLNIETVVYIPDKISEGYGLNINAINNLKENGISLIITVDCGITGILEVKEAKKLGIDIIITDHHYVPENIPDAFAIINPHSKNCRYPFKDLAGVGVAFKVVQAIYRKLLPDKIGQEKWLLDLVAIGTIADCVPLTGENRIFVKFGLMVLAKTKRVGLREIFFVGKIIIDEKNIPDTKKVSFYIAPRINAAGRVNHANLAYNLLIEKNIAKARDFALELESSNIKRQKMTENVINEVKILADNMFKDKKFIFASNEHFHIGIVGLVAGKIAQQNNKPVAIFQKGKEESKGSFRSISQINIIETIGQCSNLLERFGGHSQAAGVTVKNEKMNEFLEKMEILIEKKLQGVDLIEELLIECEIKSEDIDFNFIDSLEKIKPFGEGNNEPLFLIKNLSVKEKRIIGAGNKHFKLLLMPAGNIPKIFEAISFNGVNKFSEIKTGDIIDLVCLIQEDQWNGNRKIQLFIIDIKKV